MKGMPRPGKIRGNTDPAPQWELRGDMYNGQPVYIETVTKTVVEPAIVDGKEVWHRHPVTGEAIKRRTVARTYTVKEPFILDDLGNGIVKKNKNFEPAPGEVERREAMQSQPFDPHEMMQLLEAQQRMIDELRANVAPAEASNTVREPVPAEPVEVEDEDVNYPVHLGFGNYELSDGSTVKGKAKAHEAQAALD